MQHSIRNAATPEVTLHDGLMATAMGEAAHRSIARGTPVEMHELVD